MTNLRVVLDTNVILRAISSKSELALLLEYLFENKYSIFNTRHKWGHLSRTAYLWEFKAPNDTPDASNRKGVKKANSGTF